MSLGRLLTSGKSLVGLNDTECRYQMRAKNLLPRFGSDKNPFLKKAQTVPGVSAPQSLQAEFSRRLPAPRAVLPDATSAEPTVRPVDASARAERNSLKDNVFAKFVSSLKKLNPLNWRRQKNSSAIPRFDKAPVQTELSLDRIRVLRNDLSEADVEVVPVKIAVQPKPEKVEEKMASAPPSTPELIKT